ncbi:MAG: BON domain-containing protein [Gemmataceae bacterium]|nr:BON domain-containing protein [Gemmataceae bacterium]
MSFTHAPQYVRLSSVPCGVRAAAALAGVLLAAPAAWAEADAVRDLRCEVLAREVLGRDPALARFNIGIRVRNRIATLVGPIPSRDLAARAAAALQGMPELAAVHSELFVERLEDFPLAPRAAPPHVLTKVPAKRSPPPEPVEWVPTVPRPSAEEKDLQPTGPARPATPISRNPQAVPREASNPARHPAADIGPAVQQLLREDERFRRIHARVEAGHVILSGTAYRWEDLHELSRAVARLPGVTGVTLQAIHAYPRHR